MRSPLLTIGIVLGGAVVLAILNLVPTAGSTFHVSTYVVSLFGKYLCYAILALAVDLVWGFAGILTLGHAAFFALGGYAMGMYLMRQIGARGMYANPVLPDFMVFLNYKDLAVVLARHELVRRGHGHGGAGARRAGGSLRLPGLPLPRDGRLPVHHHPGADLCLAAGVLPQRHGVRRQ